MREQWTLGQLIDALQPLSATHTRANGTTEPRGVVFDFGSFVPSGIDSYRGFYDHLAVAYAESRVGMDLEKFRGLVNAAEGALFEGYKGGSFRMTRETPLWVANYGETGHTAIVGMIETDSRVVLETGFCG